jgi:hypothetical protein
MIRARATLAAAVLVAFPVLATAAQPQLVVLKFSGKGFTDAAIDSATSAAESAALRVSGGRFKIVTRDMLAAIVGEAKLMKCEEAARCELDLGVGLGTGYMLSGSLRKVGTRLELAVKLYDVRKLDLLAQDSESAAREDELVGRVGPLVERVMRTGLGLGGQAIDVRSSNGVADGGHGATRTLPASASASTVPCPPGQEDVGGHCCWPGQDWGMASGRCIGSPACPEGFTVSGEACVVGCSEGKDLVAGHCCWPGQDWGVRTGKCIGTPSCPEGWRLLANGECTNAAVVKKFKK